MHGMTASRTLMTVATAAAIGLLLGGCTSTTTTTTEATTPAVSPSAPASAAPTPTPTTAAPSPAVPGPVATDPASWCEAYGALASQLNGSNASPERAAEGLAAIGPLNDLISTGVELGYFSAEELDANARLFAEYTAVLTLYANGSTDDSEDVAAAQEQLSAVSTEESALIASANNKLRALCLPPEPSASPASS